MRPSITAFGHCPVCNGKAILSRTFRRGIEPLQCWAGVKIIDAPKGRTPFFFSFMPIEATSRHEQDLAFVQRVLTVDPAAASELRSRYQGKLVGVLRSRGANQTEAEDLVADLWTDCFAREKEPPDAPEQIPGALRARIMAPDGRDASAGRSETAAKFPRGGAFLPGFAGRFFRSTTPTREGQQ